ncbi:MAG: cytochrome c [Nitrospiraceae bacterium]|nr:cytochrome c [Nitrospiraceae bacterium]
MKKIFIISLILIMSAVFIAARYSYSQGTKLTIDLPEIKVELKNASGVETVKHHCSVCHSLDYITMQPNPSRIQWENTVNKMIKTFGADIPDKDVPTIINYLVTAYSKGK